VVFDTLRSPMTSETETQIAMIVNTSFPSFEYLRPSIPQQTNGVDCGYLAIAYAFEYATGRVLKKINFDVHRIRDHWEDCLRNRKVVQFPRLSEEVLDVTAEQRLTTQVHCSCRLPEHYSANMIICDACHEWYHRECENLLENEDLPEKWFCTRCTREKYSSSVLKFPKKTGKKRKIPGFFSFFPED